MVASVGVLLLVAALAFDVGMIMLERRDQQNAADAAALAGVACLPNTGCASSRAVSVASSNGFTNGVDAATVTVGASSSRVQVHISRQMPSFFARLASIMQWDVSALAIAVNQTDQPPFASLIALNPHACGSVQITGSGIVTTFGDVQINSDCSQALQIAGQGTLDLKKDGLACWVVGGAKISGKGSGLLCDPPQQGVPIPFPINDMPSNNATPRKPLQVAGPTMSIPAGCPGASDPPAVSPAPGSPDPSSPSPAPMPTAVPAAGGCQFNASYKDTTWRLYEGYYPGGIKLQGGTYYLEPGIYHLAGGGFTVTSVGTSATSVNPGGTTLGGGVLLFNTTHSTHASGPIDIGGNGGMFRLHPLGGLSESCSGPSSGWNRYLIFQDPAVTNTVKINGGSNEVFARGLILAPTAEVQINGGTGTLTIDAVIADTFKINGNGGNINVLYDSCALPTFTGYGLII